MLGLGLGHIMEVICKLTVCGKSAVALPRSCGAAAVYAKVVILLILPKSKTFLYKNVKGFCNTAL